MTNAREMASSEQTNLYGLQWHREGVQGVRTPIPLNNHKNMVSVSLCVTVSLEYLSGGIWESYDTQRLNTNARRHVCVVYCFSQEFKPLLKVRVGLQTLWRFPLKDLSIDEMVGAWCFVCCQAHRGLPVGCLLLRYQFYLLLSPYLCIISF